MAFDGEFEEVMGAGPASGSPMAGALSLGTRSAVFSTLIQLKIFKELRRMREKRQTSSGSSETESERRAGASEFQGVLRIRRRIRRRPAKGRLCLHGETRARDY